MITKIETAEDVKAFAKQLITEGVSFHPDDDFNDYVNLEESIPTYSKEEADVRNGLMNKCFEVCEKEGIDIYDVALEVSLIETEMDKFIPLPSQTYPENN
ncbi:hypothetical protein [Limnovirga soli]|uniref:Uncharacterized protein n=1 Tax=Limnovirga soli TaxID=2656915 RepID=A0A8J8JYH3_9BACT|nr:hypothetical protein [Limnovirga soli]NNV57306.1 hypothetical protein [Limnovirga soli]